MQLLHSLAGFPLVIFAAAFGLLIGSFLNVCIYRIPRDRSVIAPRSFCPACESSLCAVDNVPLLSFLLLRGRCRSCKAPISLRYPAVEAITSVLFGWVVFQYGPTLSAVKWLIFEALVVALFCTDLEVEILPDELTLGGTAAAVVLTMFVPVPGILGEIVSAGWQPVWPSFVNLAAGAFFMTVPIWLLGAAFGRVLKKDALGFGDVKLLMMLGSFLGVDLGFRVLLVGTVSGALFGVVRALATHQEPFSQTLRFGCFLCGAAAFLPLLTRIGTP